MDYQEIRQITLQYRYGPLLYLAAFVLSFVSVGLSVGMCLCLAVYFAFKGWPTIHGLKRHFASASDPTTRRARQHRKQGDRTCPGIALQR